MGVSGKVTNIPILGNIFVGEDNNELNSLNYREIRIYPRGYIKIGYFNNGESAPGNFIRIWNDGDVNVGEFYMKNGMIRYRYTEYRTDGTTRKHDY